MLASQDSDPNLTENLRQNFMLTQTLSSRTESEFLSHAIKDMNL